MEGSDSVSCGVTVFPCKTLKTAVQRVQENGRIVITGKQYISTTIKITKSMEIIGSIGTDYICSSIKEPIGSR